MTKVTIIIHEGRGGRGLADRMGRRHGHPGRPEEQTEGRGHSRHAHHHGHHGAGHGHHGAGHGEHAPGSATDEQRQLARRLRRQMRRIMREAEAAGLSPERVERVVRREGRRSYL